MSITLEFHLLHWPTPIVMTVWGWPHIPRVGDDIDFGQCESAGLPLVGKVEAVLWLSHDNVRLVVKEGGSR